MLESGRPEQEQAMRLIDLSHTIAPGMPLFSAGAPQPIVTPWMSHAQAASSGRYEGCSCEITEVRFITSMGTYLDSPYHFDPRGASIERLRLEQLVLPGVTVDCTAVQPRQPIAPHVLEGTPVVGRAVLIHTGWSRFWGQPAYHEYPFLVAETAAALRDCGACLVGIDTLVIDDMANPRRPVHVTLLQADILIVENLTNLAALPRDGFTFHAVPARVAGAAAFPVRAYAVLPD
jgi:arylformamidase